MKQFNHDVTSEDIELPVIFLVSKYKMKNGQPVLDETNQPIILSEKEIDMKHTFRKYNITVKNQILKDTVLKIEGSISEIFEVTSNRTYRVRMSYSKLNSLLSTPDQKIPQIGFRYKYRK